MCCMSKELHTVHCTFFCPEKKNSHKVWSWSDEWLVRKKMKCDWQLFVCVIAILERLQSASKPMQHRFLCRYLWLPKCFLFLISLNISHPNNFTLGTVVSWVLHNTLAKCEVDRMKVPEICKGHTDRESLLHGWVTVSEWFAKSNSCRQPMPELSAKAGSTVPFG